MSDEFWQEEFNRREIENLQKESEEIYDRAHAIGFKDHAVRIQPTMEKLQNDRDKAITIIKLAIKIIDESLYDVIDLDNFDLWKLKAKECLAKLGERSLKIETEKGVPKGEIHFRNEKGDTVGKIVNIE